MADYYSENQDQPAAPPPEDVQSEGKEGAEEPQEESGTKTDLLSKSVFPNGDISVGDVCKFKVVALHDDQAEVEYMDENGESDMGESSSTGNSRARLQAFADKT